VKATFFFRSSLKTLLYIYWFCEFHSSSFFNADSNFSGTIEDKIFSNAH